MLYSDEPNKLNSLELFNPGVETNKLRA